MIDSSTLNESQLEAVNWNGGALLVLAGSGSGKTRVIVCRIARLIEETPEKHFNILGLTFTNKAAAEMRERISALVPASHERTLLTTFHSFSADLLRQHGHHLGLKPDFTVLSQDADRLALLDEALHGVKLGHDGRSGSERLLPLVSRLAETNVGRRNAVKVLQDTYDNPEAEKIAAVYDKYRSLMIERNALDFPGLIREALNLLIRLPGVRKQIQRIYPYICVDEFQDTNLSQYMILQHIVNPETKNLFVVADDDQIIYQWNGASPERLFSIKEYFDMKILQLPENYRCPPDVVKLANRLIRNNSGRFESKKDAAAHKRTDEVSSVTARQFETFEEEAHWVARHMAKRPADSLPNCVVLARTRKLLEKIVEALEEQGIEGYLAVRKNEFESASLKWLHSILRLANARGNREYLHVACKMFYSLEGIGFNVKDIAAQAASCDGDYLRAWMCAALKNGGLSEECRNLVSNHLRRLSERLDFWAFQDAAFKWLDKLPDTVPDEGGIFDEYTEEKNTWRTLVDEISAQYGKDEITLNLLLQELDLRSKTPPHPDNAVPCFTIHSSKGMEFDHVYLVGLVEDQLPSWQAIKKEKGNSSREMQEERRNCFVAITRAQKSLCLSWAKRVQGREKTPSRFLNEMGIRATLETKPLAVTPA